MAHQALADTLEQQERTASWLARKCGKSPSYLTRVLNGERKPSAEFRRRAAEVLGVPESLLFDPTASEA